MVFVRKSIINQKRLLKKKRQARTKLVSSARNGDENAIESLTLDDMDLYTTLSKKIRKQDIYSLVYILHVLIAVKEFFSAV